MRCYPRVLPRSTQQERTCVRDWSGDDRKARGSNKSKTTGISTAIRSNLFPPSLHFKKSNIPILSFNILYLSERSFEDVAIFIIAT